MPKDNIPMDSCIYSNILLIVDYKPDLHSMVSNILEDIGFKSIFLVT